MVVVVVVVVVVAVAVAVVAVAVAVVAVVAVVVVVVVVLGCNDSTPSDGCQQSQSSIEGRRLHLVPHLAAFFPCVFVGQQWKRSLYLRNRGVDGRYVVPSIWYLLPRNTHL